MIIKIIMLGIFLLAMLIMMMIALMEIKNTWRKNLAVVLTAETGILVGVFLMMVFQ